MTYSGDVREFMYAMGQIVRIYPFIPSFAERALRMKLIREECAELEHELTSLEIDINGKQDSDTSDARYTKFDPYERLARIAQETADVLYVTLGTCAAYGIPFDAVWALVREANLAKARGPMREDGKKLKPEGWESPYPKIKQLVTGLRKLEND